MDRSAVIRPLRAPMIGGRRTAAELKSPAAAILITDAGGKQVARPRSRTEGRRDATADDAVLVSPRPAAGRQPGAVRGHRPGPGETAATSSPRSSGSRASGAAGRPARPRAGGCWSSLVALDGELRRLGSRLALGQGDPAVALPELARAASAGTVVWAAGLEPDELADDDAVAAALAGIGVEAVVVPSANLLFDPAPIRTREGRPYTVFTPYWRACLSGPAPAAPLAAPEALPRGAAEAGRPRARRARGRGRGSLDRRVRRASGSRAKPAPTGRLARLAARSPRRLRRRPRPAGPREHLAPLAPPALGRAERAPGVAGRRRRARRGRPRPRGRHRPADAGRRAGAGPAAVRRRLPPPARLARVRAPPAVPLPAHARAAAARALRRLPLAGRPGRARGLAARPDRLPARGRRDARALGHRLDAQPRAHGRGVLPRQAPAAAVAAAASAGSGTRSSTPTSRTTPSAGSGWPAAAPTRRRTSASSTR